MTLGETVSLQQLNGLKFRPSLQYRRAHRDADDRSKQHASGDHLASLSVPKNSPATPDLGSER
jgi:hypothetical protein